MTHITPQRFRQLLEQSEGETLDFKENVYDLAQSRNAFIKDVLSMANTPRTDSAYIVLGVRWSSDSGSTIVGIDRQVDDVHFQNAFGQGRVQPIPRFTYTPIVVNGRHVGVVEIPIQRTGPFTPIKDYDGLHAGVTYFRRGTQNDRAVGAELINIFRGFTVVKSLAMANTACILGSSSRKLFAVSSRAQPICW